MAKLYLSSSDKKLAGVCGGLAQYFGGDSSAVRVLWVLGTIVTGVFPGIVAYIVAAIIIPSEKDQQAEDNENSNSKPQT